MLKIERILIVVSLLCLLLITACGKLPDGIVDIENFKQNNLAYLLEQDMDTNLITTANQKKFDDKSTKYFFAPWNLKEPLYKINSIQAIINEYKYNLGFGENKQKHDLKWIQDLETLAGLGNYPNCQKKAITIHNSNLRLLPTNHPHFNDFSLAGEGFPFDNLQNSAIWANTPVFVSHLSKDKRWALVEGPFCIGWLSIDDIAFVNEDFIRQWSQLSLLAIIKDNTSICDTENSARLTLHIGALLPKVAETTENYQCLIAVADIAGQAVILQGYISKSAAVQKPYPATAHNIAQLANELLGQTYGWGGLYENRDCSAMLKDLFLTFGIWLPRNSNSLSSATNFISLKGLTNEGKEKEIIEKGVPFLTLIWLKGHVMLYVGNNDGKVAVFHNLWGIRTKDFFSGKDGRFIIGKAIITSLEPGKELPNLGPNANLLPRVDGMIILK